MDTNSADGWEWTQREGSPAAENVGQRGSTWFYRVDLPPGPDGWRRQKRESGFLTEKAAKLALAKAVVDVSQGKLRWRHGSSASWPPSGSTR